MYRVSASFAALLLNTFMAEGLDVARLCRDAGLDRQRLQQADAFFRRRTIYRLLELAAVESGNPNIGLKTYAHFLPGSFQLVGYVMMSSPNLKEALERLVRFTPLLGNGVTVLFTREQGCHRLSFEEHPEAGIARPRQASDAAAAALLGFCRWLTGGNLQRPLAIELDYPEPPDIAEHQRLFDCPLHFGAARASILFASQELLAPLSTANEALATLHESFAEARLSLLCGHSLAARVRTLITENLDRGGCDMASVAKALCISKRTLQRGLEREGVQFKDVLGAVRRQLADYYLRHTQDSLAQVAERLGFLEQSSFHKACLRWFGVSPGRYRLGEGALADGASGEDTARAADGDDAIDERQQGDDARPPCACRSGGVCSC
ncbi:AraC family transcriptional regulator [Phytopseudomonas dryadis]|uniref:AraC family transcriptional regulator n=1 Tax=Phytopseudomonas dryadis TaxID=2487520 RepID=A0A4Q9R4L4_9GAMM|nr:MULTISPECIES: AraC family transcriptional regulator [Pseudomonas]TBU95387.1 AraC family transcriptional regulator [Pseudomonas dryadis]TBV08186.1 AraC family transcriptional regulator [Pseudomonas dryadis]TBV19812.1 AraC family transcriptional regulator [Pseudomonas sp. FRB 230]